MTQRKHILGVNVVLLVAALGLGWKLVGDWRWNAVRQLDNLVDSRKGISGFVLPPERAPSGAGGQVVAANMFSRDRNNIVAAPAEESTPPPPLPVVIGTMRLGSSYEALMAESAQNASTAFKQVRAGAVI